MQVTTKITVDMTRQNVGQRVNAVQGDGNTRSAEITLLSGGQPWTPPEGVDVAIAYYQPDGHKGLYNLLADGSEAISMAGNVATIILAPQMLTVSGTVQASLVFNDAALNRLTTFPFSVCVASNPSAGAQKVEDYLRLQWLEDKLDEYLRKAADSGAFDGKPGDNGVTFTPSVSENGDLSWRNNGGLPNPQTVNIRGQQGDSTAATAAANAAKTSAANAETHAADATAAAAAAQEAVGAMGTELSQIKDDLSAEQTAREQADTSLQQEISGKLPKSPADWEPWTAEEQAAARERIGVSCDFELIETINVTESINKIERFTDLYGEDYYFKRIYVSIDRQSGTGSLTIKVLQRKPRFSGEFVSDSTVLSASSKSGYGYADADFSSGIMRRKASSNLVNKTYVQNSVSSVAQLVVNGVDNWDNIKGIRIQAEDIGVGSTFIIYGVRA